MNHEWRLIDTNVELRWWLKVLRKMRMEPKDVIKTSRQILAEIAEVKLALLYGSIAAGRYHAASDLDIAVLWANPIALEIRMALVSRLSLAVDYEVDLVNLDEAGPLLLKQILTKGELLVCRDERAYTLLAKRVIYDASDFLPLLEEAKLARLRSFVNG